MTAVQLFLIAWHALTLRACNVYLGGYAGATGGPTPHIVVPNFIYQGWCDQAVLIAKAAGGFWSFA